MPFIWNDFEWKLVDDEDPYDKDRFFVARKLLVKPAQLNAPNEVFSGESIHRYFRKFGEIESIEMLPNSISEAHVTFVSDRIACLVQSHYELGKKMGEEQAYEIEPAYTWEQPLKRVDPSPENETEDNEEQTSEIFKLNEDCLLHMFRYLDLDSLVNMAFVCKMFNRLLRQHCFPRIRKYKVYNCNSINALAKVRRTLLCIGQHINDLSLTNYHIQGIEMCGSVVQTSKFLKVIAENVGQNIHRASFVFDFDENYIVTLASILRNLKSLRIADNDPLLSRSFIIDFPALCPNLIELKVNMILPMDACCKPWPSLQTLWLINNLELEAETLVSIIQQNPQLTRFRIDVYNSDNRVLFEAITQHLTSLKVLQIEFMRLSLHFRFIGLGQLPSLSEISLIDLSIYNLEAILDHLSKYSNLRKIEFEADTFVSGIQYYEQSLVNLMKQLPLLEELKLMKIPVKEETVFDIVRFGKHLKTLHIYSSGLDFSDDFISKLVDVLKCHRLESNEALQLWLSEEDFGKLDAVKNKEHSRYLQVKLSNV